MGIELNKRVSDGDDASQEVKDLAFVLLDTAMINSGFSMENAGEFSQRMYRVMQSGLGLDSLELEDHIEVVEDNNNDDEGEEEEEELFDDNEDAADSEKGSVDTKDEL